MRWSARKTRVPGAKIAPMQFGGSRDSLTGWTTATTTEYMPMRRCSFGWRRKSRCRRGWVWGYPLGMTNKRSLNDEKLKIFQYPSYSFMRYPKLMDIHKDKANEPNL